MKAGPFQIRFNEDDAKLVTYLQDRLGLEVAQVLRLGLRRLAQLERATEKKDGTR